MEHKVCHYLVISCVFFAGAQADSTVEIIATENTVRIGQKLNLYCATVSGSSNITWYKRKGDVQYTLAQGLLVEKPFSETGRYSIRQWDYGVNPLELEIAGVQKADEGIIGCSYEGHSAETEVLVLGSITEVFVDMKPYGGREVAYKELGEIIEFRDPQPQFGYSAKCHVQATTRNISIIMELGGNEIASQLDRIDADPIRAEPLQERIFVLHRYVNNFKPGADQHGQKLECIASTPNYPKVEVRNNVILHVQHKPRGECTTIQPIDCSESLLVKCEMTYNPMFIFASWTILSSRASYSGYSSAADNVSTSYNISGEFGGTFYLEMNCSEDMPAEDNIQFNIGNWVGSETATVTVQRPSWPTTTTTTTEVPPSYGPGLPNNASMQDNSSTVVSSGDHGDDEDEVPEVLAVNDEPASSAHITSQTTSSDQPPDISDQPPDTSDQAPDTSDQPPDISDQAPDTSDSKVELKAIWIQPNTSCVPSHSLTVYILLLVNSLLL